MDTKTSSYIVVSNSNKEQFEKKINELLIAGYSLQGGISVIKKDSKEKMYNSHSYNSESYYNDSYYNEPFQDDSLIYFQALIKN
jgi:hypothetical protein